MGVFSRVRDIIGANLNAMLDKAEDPEKLIKMMIREMEDTLVEIKASCAGAMATKKKIQREIEEVEGRIAQWNDRAKLAVEKGREDLAREALLERRRYTERRETLEAELDEAAALVNQYKEEIVQLEEKLSSAREKQRILVQRHIHATRKKQAQHDLRKVDSAEAMARIERFEGHIDRLEAEADLVNYGRRPSLDEQFAALKEDGEVDEELKQLKAEVDAEKGGGQA
jgi:phage shock protein A